MITGDLNQLALLRPNGSDKNGNGEPAILVRTHGSLTNEHRVSLDSQDRMNFHIVVYKSSFKGPS